MSLSIVIPTLNEAAVLDQTLGAIAGTDANIEVLVVDGGSQDDTCAIAQSWGAKLLHSAPGRARQMNLGAQMAQNEILLFLHGDTLLPPGYYELIETTIAQPQTIAGAFDLTINAPEVSLRFVEWGVKLRSRLLQLPYGDQGIFLRRETFGAIGGYPDLAIMEDYQLINNLKRLGRIAIIPTPVKTHPRRWQTLGILRTTLLNQIMILGYHLGIPPEKLRTWYRWYNRHSAPYKTPICLKPSSSTSTASSSTTKKPTKD
ncbi:MAG: glycosyltransferase family 2 protein [Alkalinema sp. RU_4_3]|nr:glycosyltransferase family 2 protein [Alkalinema sp. RU_4_3]